MLRLRRIRLKLDRLGDLPPKTVFFGALRWLAWEANGDRIVSYQTHTDYADRERVLTLRYRGEPRQLRPDFHPALTRKVQI